jgi:hypothetical protein
MTDNLRARPSWSRLKIGLRLWGPVAGHSRLTDKPLMHRACRLSAICRFMAPGTQHQSIILQKLHMEKRPLAL